MQIRGSYKYGSTGGCSLLKLTNLDLPQRALETISELGNFGLTQNTWSSYKTAKKMWDLCQTETKTQLALPWSQHESFIFIDWLVNDRKVSSGTINSYLAGIAKFHVLNGFEAPLLKTPLIKQVIKGKQNKESILRRTTGQNGRLAVTIDVMTLLLDKIKKWDTPSNRKRLVWSVATMAFFGGVRIHEILAKNESFFDPDFTLLGHDIKMTTWHNCAKAIKILEVTIKAPKENKNGQDIVIDIFESDNELCPVYAFEQWKNSDNPLKPDRPAFREMDGTPLTGRKFNTYLKILLKEDFDYKSGKITSHSFRSGLATMSATVGLSISEIKAAGRWNSRAYERYMKLPRAQRALLAEKLSQVVR